MGDWLSPSPDPPPALWTCGNAATRYAQAPITRIDDEATVSTDHAH